MNLSLCWMELNPETPQNMFVSYFFDISLNFAIAVAISRCCITGSSRHAALLTWLQGFHNLTFFSQWHSSNKLTNATAFAPKRLRYSFK